MEKNNIIKPILFLSGLFLLLYLLSCLAIPYNSMEDGIYKKMRGVLSVPKNTVDYVTIGDSECSSSISPMDLWKKYGYVGYNCGVPGQRLQDTYYLLQNLLKDQSPKVVLLETNAFYRNFEYTNALQDAVDEEAQKIFPIYKYHNGWKSFTFDMFKNTRSKSRLSPSSVFKGFEYSAAVKPYTGGPYVHKTRDIEKIDDEPLFYLDKIVDLCRDRNIQLILYSAPSPLCWTYAKHNAAAAFAKENHLSYVDLNLHTAALRINWAKDTRDKGNHLNCYGARKVTRYMGAYLFRHTDLRDHRGEKTYISWNEILKSYLILTGRT